MWMKKFRILLGTIIFVLIIMSLNVNSAFELSGSNDELIKAYKNGSLVRLHVVANSNSPRDQYLKRYVRDQLLDYISRYAEQDNFVIEKKMPEVEQYINTILQQEGAIYCSKVELGEYLFPDRTYQNITLPEGRYKALKVILGSGSGANWWCVLLPPMCVENKKESNDEGQLELRFKFLDLLKNKKTNNVKNTSADSSASSEYRKYNNTLANQSVLEPVKPGEFKNHNAIIDKVNIDRQKIELEIPDFQKYFETNNKTPDLFRIDRIKLIF